MRFILFLLRETHPMGRLKSEYLVWYDNTILLRTINFPRKSVVYGTECVETIGECFYCLLRGIQYFLLPPYSVFVKKKKQANVYNILKVIVEYFRNKLKNIDPGLCALAFRWPFDERSNFSEKRQSKMDATKC